MTDFNREQDTPLSGNRNRAGYAEWIALGAVVAGSVGAIVGAARCAQRNSHKDYFDSVRSDPATLTAPHGDKLSSLL